jgi:hypothetical protein
MAKKPDPTLNVIRLNKNGIKGVNDKVKIHIKYLSQLMKAEAKRIDANRSGDVSAVALANERAINQAAILAKQVNDSAQMLALQLQSMEGKLTERITALERSQYVDTGKSSLWTNPLFVGVVAAILAYLLGKFTK